LVLVVKVSNQLDDADFFRPRRSPVIKRRNISMKNVTRPGGIERSDYDEDEDYEGVKNKDGGSLSVGNKGETMTMMKAVTTRPRMMKAVTTTITSLVKDSETASLERSHTSRRKGGQAEQSRNCH
jgi:hypothetical protein